MFGPLRNYWERRSIRDFRKDFPWNRYAFGSAAGANKTLYCQIQSFKKYRLI